MPLAPFRKAATEPWRTAGKIPNDAGNLLDPEMFGSVAQHANPAQPRSLIDRCDVLRQEAFVSDADIYHHDILALIKRRIHAAFNDAVTANHGDDFVILDQFGCHLRRYVGSPLIVGHDVFDWTAINTAIGIHALEKGVRRLG